jgi:hypothetical protein
MKLERNFNVSRLPKGNTPYSTDINNTLFIKFGLSGMHGNFEGNRELTLEEIKEVSDLISSVDGRTKVYDQWLHPKTTDFWRLTLGYDGK